MMPTYRVITAQDVEHFHRLSNQMERADGPAFLANDQAVDRHWSQLAELFPDNQFCLVDEETGQTAGIGNSIPLAFTGSWSELPEEGLDWALERGIQDRLACDEPTLMSALYIEIAGSHRGQRLSLRMLAEMRRIGRSQGFDHLIAPVRPSLKSRYPLIDMARYLDWRAPDGQPFDPWLRVHVQAGGRVLHICRRAMTITGSPEQWADWTSMAFPGDGDYVIPHGLVPVRVRGDVGEYLEPGVWVLHQLSDAL